VGINILLAFMVAALSYVNNKHREDSSAIGFDVDTKTDETVILGFR